MEVTKELADALARIEGEPMAAQLRQAVSRVEVAEDSVGPYWSAPDGAAALTAPEPTLIHEDGTDETADEAEARGCELIVLATLARIAARGQNRDSDA